MARHPGAPVVGRESRRRFSFRHQFTHQQNLVAGATHNPPAVARHKAYSHTRPGGPGA